MENITPFTKIGPSLIIWQYYGNYFESFVAMNSICWEIRQKFKDNITIYEEAFSQEGQRKISEIHWLNFELIIPFLLKGERYRFLEIECVVKDDSFLSFLEFLEKVESPKTLRFSTINLNTWHFNHTEHIATYNNI